MTGIRHWLEGLDLPQYADAFEANDIDVSLLPDLNDQVLKDIGVASAGHRLSAAQLMVYVLEQSGEDLTRENVLRQAINVKNLQLPMMLPGIKIDTGPADYFPVEQLQLIRFDGKRWVRVGEITGDKESR